MPFGDRQAYGWLFQEGGSLLDANASVPSGLTRQSFVATPLTAANVALDYAACMASPDVIRLHSDGRWVVDGYALEGNRENPLAEEVDRRQVLAALLSAVLRQGAQVPKISTV